MEKTCAYATEYYVACGDKVRPSFLHHLFRRKEPATIHHLKTLPDYFHDVVAGKKRFEVRKADRPFKVGDTIVLNEWDGYLEGYTGYSCRGTITYILQGGVYGISRRYVVIGFRYQGLTDKCMGRASWPIHVVLRRAFSGYLGQWASRLNN